LIRLDLDTVDLLADRDGFGAGLQRAHIFNLGLELGYRFFEIEIRAHYAIPTFITITRG
jgi:hypothetical protein